MTEDIHKSVWQFGSQWTTVKNDDCPGHHLLPAFNGWRVAGTCEVLLKSMSHDQIQYQMMSK